MWIERQSGPDGYTETKRAIGANCTEFKVIVSVGGTTIGKLPVNDAVAILVFLGNLFLAAASGYEIGAWMTKDSPTPSA